MGFIEAVPFLPINSAISLEAASGRRAVGRIDEVRAKLPKYHKARASRDVPLHVLHPCPYVRFGSATVCEIEYPVGYPP